MVSTETDRLLTQRLAVEQSSSRIPSIVGCLVRQGKAVWFGAAGEVAGSLPGDETQYRCGSISKTFIAVEIMRLRDEGRLDLSDPVTQHAPELSALSATIGHLLSHTSGLRAETAGPWWERSPGVDFARLAATSLRAEDVLARPGRRFHYSNVGFAVLGEIVGRIRGTTWFDAIADELLRPLGMVRTSRRPIDPAASGLGVHPHADVVITEPEHDAGAMAPAGQLWTTADDLARWAALLGGFRPDLLAADSLEEMREPVALIDTPEQPWTAAYGHGLQLFNRGGVRSYGHSGSMPGFLASLRVDETSKDAVVVLANATSGLDFAVEADLLRIFQEREPLVVPWRTAAGGVAPEQLGITGAWYWGTSCFVVSVRGDKLEVHAMTSGREASFAPSPSGDGSYIGLSGYYHGEALRVVHHPDGTLSHLDIGSFVLTRTPYDPAAPLPGGFDAEGWVGGPADEPDAERAHLPRLGHMRRRP